MPGPKPSAPCGTTSAYRRHQRNGETPCTACRQAWADYHRARYAAQKAGAADQ